MPTKPRSFLSPLKILEQAAQHLENYKEQYAIAGGLAASFYRKRPRLTNDVDIILDVKNYETSKTAAEEVIQKMGFKSSLGWIVAPRERISKSISLVIGKPGNDEVECTIDILLPVLPWVSEAVRRAQSNPIDFGFARLPTITPEDLLVAKAFALSIEPQRFQDLDDIQAILSQENHLDLSYLFEAFEKHTLSLPLSLRPSVPTKLKRLLSSR